MARWQRPLGHFFVLGSGQLSIAVFRLSKSFLAHGNRNVGSSLAYPTLASSGSGAMIRTPSHAPVRPLRLLNTAVLP